MNPLTTVNTRPVVVPFARPLAAPDTRRKAGGRAADAAFRDGTPPGFRGHHRIRGGQP